MKKLLFIIITFFNLRIQAQTKIAPQSCSELFISEMTFEKAPQSGNIWDMNYAIEFLIQLNFQSI